MTHVAQLIIFVNLIRIKKFIENERAKGNNNEHKRHREGKTHKRSEKMICARIRSLGLKRQNKKIII